MKDNTDLQRRVGAWVQARREQLGMSQGDVRKKLGYQSTASISNIEQGRTVVPTRRAYAWADVLEVDRTAFFEFATGLRTTLSPTPAEPRDDNASLTPAEASLIAHHRGLPVRLQRKLLAYAVELAGSAARKQRKR